MTTEDLQQQVDMLQDQVHSLNEEVLSLSGELKKAHEDADTAHRWWMESERKRDEAVNMIKSLKTVMAALDVELFKN